MNAARGTGANTDHRTNSSAKWPRRSKTAKDQKYKHDAQASESGGHEGHESRDMSLDASRSPGSAAIHGPVPIDSLARATCLYTHSLARRACNEKTCAPAGPPWRTGRARAVTPPNCSNPMLPARGGVHARR